MIKSTVVEAIKKMKQALPLVPGPTTPLVLEENNVTM